MMPCSNIFFSMYKVKKFFELMRNICKHI
jgi:hypothetical protein